MRTLLPYVPQELRDIDVTRVTSYFCHRITQVREIQGKRAGNLCKLQKKFGAALPRSRSVLPQNAPCRRCRRGERQPLLWKTSFKNTLETQKIPLRSSNGSGAGILERSKALSPLGLKAFNGAAGRIRTAGLILTKRLFDFFLTIFGAL